MNDVVRLPLPLRPWRPWLQLFDPSLIEPLGEMVKRLDRHLGDQASSSTPREHGEVDGYEGLTRRGPVDRLLTTEHLLLLEEPLEFIRRHGAREQLHLELDRRSRVDIHRCLVLVDLGPQALGSLRVVLLAGLIVLARRARDHGLTFETAILQDGFPSTSGTLDEARICDLLGGIRLRDPSELDWASWEAATSRNGPGDEVWLLGDGRRHERGARSVFGRALRSFQIDDVYALDGLAADVEIRDGSRRRALRLPLPESRVCLQLVRDPFRRAFDPGPVPRRGRHHNFLRPRGRPKFCGNGNLVVPLEGGGLYWVRAKRRPLAFCPLPGHRFVGAAALHRGLLLLSQRTEDGRLLLHDHGPNGGPRHPPLTVRPLGRESFRAPEGLVDMVAARTDRTWTAGFLGESGELFELTPNMGYRLLGTGWLRLESLEPALIGALGYQRVDGGGRIHRLSRKLESEDQRPLDDAPHRLQFGSGGPQPSDTMVAYSRDGRWVCRPLWPDSPSDDEFETEPADSWLVGPIQMRSGRGARRVSRGVLLVSKDDTTLLFRDGTEHRSLVRGEPVEHAVMSLGDGKVALLRSGGLLQLFDFGEADPLRPIRELQISSSPFGWARQPELEA